MTKSQQYLTDKSEDLQTWITGGEDSFQSNAWQWEIDME
jgi:hypothetical protein